MDSNNFDNIYSINKECLKIRKQILEIDEIIKIEEIKKKTLNDRLYELNKKKEN
tara:strand:- start:30 stop:191 length:162 start_codon:yes stop_codon:yes gene_type:complete